MPEEKEIMTRMISQNPYSRSGHSAIGAKEGILFSDIRLHLALVLRSKNTHVFRPDLFRNSLEPSEEILEGLANSHSMVKVRFISEQPLNDDRHLQFLPHMAAAVCDLGQGLLIYDVSAERMLTPKEMGEMLATDLDATRYEVHVNVVWEKELRSGHTETKGLIKKGLPEIRTEDAHLDQRVLVQEVMSEAARALWQLTDIPAQVEVAAYGDQFRLDITRTKTGPFKARIFRMGAA
jgi:hypothetical protein